MLSVPRSRKAFAWEAMSAGGAVTLVDWMG